MKNSLICVPFLLLYLTSFGQIILSDTGFTNKEEAKNLIENGLKEGKWIEYFKVDNKGTEMATKKANASTYRLTIYEAGRPYGTVYEYYKSGNLKSETSYINGKIQGTRKIYSEQGHLIVESSIMDDKENGIIRTYYENGNLDLELPFTRDGSNSEAKIEIGKTKIHVYGNMNGVIKKYYESGTLKYETIINNDVEGETKNYDESGKEIK